MRKSIKKGFTIIEFSLALTFIVTLLVAISVFTIRLTRIYQKGLTVRSLNMVSREIIDDLNNTIRPSAVPTSDIFKRQASISAAIEQMNKNYFFVKKAEDNGLAQQEFGAFCTNSYTYVYNTIAAMGDSSKGITLDYFSGSSKKYKLAKFKDFGCMVYKDIYDNVEDGYDSMTINVYNEPLEVLGNSEIDLHILDFVVNPAYQDPITNHVVYNISFTLGTGQGDIDMTSHDNYCQELNSVTLSYCSVNKFNVTIIQTGDSQGV